MARRKGTAGVNHGGESGKNMYSIHPADLLNRAALCQMLINAGIYAARLPGIRVPERGAIPLGE